MEKHARVGPPCLRLGLDRIASRSRALIFADAPTSILISPSLTLTSDRGSPPAACWACTRAKHSKKVMSNTSCVDKPVVFCQISGSGDPRANPWEGAKLVLWPRVAKWAGGRNLRLQTYIKFWLPHCPTLAPTHTYQETISSQFVAGKHPEEEASEGLRTVSPDCCLCPSPCWSTRCFGKRCIESARCRPR